MRDGPARAPSGIGRPNFGGGEPTGNPLAGSGAQASPKVFQRAKLEGKGPSSEILLSERSEVLCGSLDYLRTIPGFLEQTAFMTERKALALTALVFGTLVLSGLMTAQQALEFCRSLVQIVSALSEIVTAA